MRRTLFLIALPVAATLGIALLGATSASGSVAVAGGYKPHAAKCTINGASGDDVLVGTKGDDVICGRGGDDVIRGLGGNDILRGGPGKDRLYGGPGHDQVVGEADADTLHGGPGNDLLVGGGEDGDKYVGGAGDDVKQEDDNLKTGSAWDIYIDPQYRGLPDGTTVNWRYTGASDCISYPLNDVTWTLPDSRGTSFMVFEVPSTWATDRCAWVTSSGYWEVTITTPSKRVAKGQFFVHTGAPQRITHSATADCKYWSDVHCEGDTSTVLADVGKAVKLDVVIGPFQ